jgi:integrase
MLNDSIIRAAKPKNKQYKLTDGRGLSLLVKPNGSKSWLFRYVSPTHRKQRLTSFGPYPDLKLADARDMREEWRNKVAKGVDPLDERRAADALRKAEAENDKRTLQAVADEWFSGGCKYGQKRQKRPPSSQTIEQHRARFDKHLSPFLGSRPVTAITTDDLIVRLRNLEDRPETAYRVGVLAKRVLHYARRKGYVTENVAEDISEEYPHVEPKGFSAITDPKSLAPLLRAIDGYSGQPATQFALKLLPHLFVRPGELRNARWSQFDIDAALWRIPGEQMKTGEPHLVPLSTQVVAMLEELRPITCGDDCDLLFPGIRSKDRPISDNTLCAALRGLGYGKEEVTAHGFRKTASTNLHEQSFDSMLIELQLAHTDSNKVRAIYNQSERLAERRDMMQHWSNYLDGLKAGKASATVTALHG